MLFYHVADSAADSFRCINQQPTADSSGWNEQVLISPLVGVYEACAGGTPAIVSYDSYPNASVQAGDVTGSIDVYLQAETCSSVSQAVREKSMIVTAVVVDPFLGGAGPVSTPVPLIHQAPAAECAARVDFFTVWYDHGLQKVCFANAGFLRLSQPLTGVVRVYGGLNSGEALSWAVRSVDSPWDWVLRCRTSARPRQCCWARKVSPSMRSRSRRCHKGGASAWSMQRPFLRHTSGLSLASDAVCRFLKPSFLLPVFQVVS